MQNIPNALAFWRPAIQESTLAKTYPYVFSHEIDHMSILARIAIVSTAALVALSLTILSPLDNLLPVCILSIAYIENWWESWRAAQALNQIAVDLFTQGSKVSYRAVHYLQYNPHGVRLLLAQENCDLNRVEDRYNRSLLENVIDHFDNNLATLEVFKFLISQMEKVQPELFSNCIKHPELALHIVKAGKIKPSDVNQEQLCDQLTQNPEMATILKEYGFLLDVDQD